MEIEEENAKQISAAVETASRTKFQKLQDQLDKAIKDKEFHVGVSKHLPSELYIILYYINYQFFSQVNDSLKKAGSDLEQQLKRLEARYFFHCTVNLLMSSMLYWSFVISGKQLPRNQKTKGSSSWKKRLVKPCYLYSPFSFLSFSSILLLKFVISVFS